jgi:hydrogenase maturation protease
MNAEQTTLEAPASAPTIAIIGVGNLYRRDDAVGLHVARLLRRELPRSVRITEIGIDPMSLIEAWEGANIAIVIDAVSSGAGPGTVFRFNVCGQPIPSHLFHYSTHDLNVADAIELARALEKLPSRLVVYGIEGADFGDGTGMSSEVSEAARGVACSVQEYVGAALGQKGVGK